MLWGTEFVNSEVGWSLTQSVWLWNPCSNDSTELLMTQAGQSEWTWGLQLRELGRLAPFAVCSVHTRCESWNYSSIWLLQEKLGWVQDQYMEVVEVKGQTESESVLGCCLKFIVSEAINSILKIGLSWIFKSTLISFDLQKKLYTCILSYLHLLHENICTCVHHLYLPMNMV